MCFRVRIVCSRIDVSGLLNGSSRGISGLVVFMVRWDWWYFKVWVDVFRGLRFCGWEYEFGCCYFGYVGGFFISWFTGGGYGYLGWQGVSTAWIWICVVEVFCWCLCGIVQGLIGRDDMYWGGCVLVS